MCLWYKNAVKEKMFIISWASWRVAYLLSGQELAGCPWGRLTGILTKAKTVHVSVPSFLPSEGLITSCARQ